MTETVQYRFLCRRGTAAALAAANEVPLSGEIYKELDTGREKTGDGTTHYNDLPYSIVGPASIEDLADGDTMVWDSARRLWLPGTAGAAIEAGGGIDITEDSSGVKIISSTVGAIALSGRVATYADLPTGLVTGDAGKAYLVDADDLVYVWSGSAWPSSGAGLSLTAAPAPQLDPHWSNVIVYAALNGAQGATSFTDSQGNAWNTGSAPASYLDAVAPRFGSASLYGPLGNAASGFICTAAATGQIAADFTIDAWFRQAKSSGAQVYRFGTESTGRLVLYQFSAGAFGLNIYGSSSYIAQTPNIPLDGAWHHVEFGRSGTTVYSFVDGILRATGTLSGAFGNTGGATIGKYWEGWIDAVRVTNGVCRHTSSFVPDQAPPLQA